MLIETINSKEWIESVKKNRMLESILIEIDRTRSELLDTEIENISFHLFMDYYTTGTRVRYEKLFFARRKRLLTFGLSLLLNRDTVEEERDLLALEEVLWSICDEYSWCLPAHMREDEPLTVDLFASETAFTLMEICALHRDKLNPLIVTRCIAEVNRRVLELFLDGNRSFNWEAMENNWCAVCAGAIGMAAMYQWAFFSEDTTKLKQVTDRIKPTMERFIRSFSDDGACLEGLGYWTYGVTFYASYYKMVEDFSVRTDENGFDNLKFKAIAEFQQKCYMNNSMTLSFSDGSTHEKFRLGLTAFLENRFNTVNYQSKKQHCFSVRIIKEIEG